jgi:2-phosphosulfolactate phosphatase
MEFRRALLDTCGDATDTVVIIDVLRAFSSAAYAFAARAPSITLVATVEEAFELKRSMAGALIMGEVDGLPVPGFDFSNSPASFDRIDLANHPMIQRTTRGTQGAVLSRNAKRLLTCSFCCAGATARLIRRESRETVTFVITGSGPGGKGDEDVACADFVEALLKGETPDPGEFTKRVYDSPAGHRFLDPSEPDFPPLDLEHCVRVDRFDFAMAVTRQDGRLVMEAVWP